MNNWGNLPLAQKSELMKIYLQSGITSLDDMQKHYNTFATGGEMNPDDDKIYTISEETKKLLESYAEDYSIRPYTAELHTAKFLNPQYKIGHSWLEAYPEQGNDMMPPYVSRKARISKGFKDSGYNLITNNCSDATAKALGIPSNGITTPLNVRNYVLNNFSDVTQSKDINGVDMLTFPISKAQYERILAANLSQKKDNLVDLINKQIDVQDYSYNLLNNYIDRINALGYIGNEFATGGRLDEPPFVKRYSEGQERAISTPHGNATHLLAVATDDNGAVVYPTVQPVDYNDSTSNLMLVDDSNFGALRRAIEHGDTLRFNTEKEALNYTENYKRPPSLGAMLNNPPETVLDFSKGRFFKEGGHVFQDGSWLNYIKPKIKYPEYRIPASDVDDETWLNWWYSHRDRQLGDYKDTVLSTIPKVMATPVRFKPQPKDMPYTGAMYDGEDNTIDVYPWKVRDTDLFHERVHALNNLVPDAHLVPNVAYDANGFIPNYYEQTNQMLDKVGNNGVDAYWDNKSEIYSRLMEARRGLRLLPTQYIDKQQIDKWRTDGTLQKYNLDFYSTEQLLNLFNNVADNSTNNTPVNIAAKGGHLYQDGGYRNENNSLISAGANQQDIDNFVLDYAYRAAKEKPDVTTEDIFNVLNNTNFVLTNNNSPLIGGFTNGNTITMPLKRDYTEFSDGLSHELSHRLRSGIFGSFNSLSSTNRELLRKAYPNFNGRNILSFDDKEMAKDKERIATNTQIRAKLSKLYGVYGKELDDRIDEMSDTEILNAVNNINGYILPVPNIYGAEDDDLLEPTKREYYNDEEVQQLEAERLKKLQDPYYYISGSDRVPYIKQALKEIAQNSSSQDTSHYAANGGPLGKITPYGQWQYPHQVTTIPSNNITMKGVNYPVLGVSDTGDTKYMLPNTDYLFDGNYVTEYPLHTYQDGGPKGGGSLDIGPDSPSMILLGAQIDAMNQKFKSGTSAIQNMNVKLDPFKLTPEEIAFKKEYERLQAEEAQRRKEARQKADDKLRADLTGKNGFWTMVGAGLSRAGDPLTSGSPSIIADDANRLEAVGLEDEANRLRAYSTAIGLAGLTGYTAPFMLGSSTANLWGNTALKFLNKTQMFTPKAVASLIAGTTLAHGVDSTIQEKTKGQYTGLPNFVSDNLFDGSEATEQFLEFIRPEYGVLGAGERLLDRGVNIASKLPLYAKEFPSLAKALKSDIKLELDTRKFLRQLDRTIRYDIGRGNLLKHEEDYLPRTKLYFKNDTLKALREVSEATERVEKLNAEHPNSVADRRLHSKEGGDNLGRIGRQGENKDVITLELNDTREVNGPVSYPITFDGVSGHKTIHGKWEFNPIIPAPNTSAEYAGWNYRISDGQIPTGKLITGLTTEAQISENVRGAVIKRFKEATALAGEDGVVIGSTRTISGGAVNDVPHDVEFFTTAKRAKALQKKIGFTKTRNTAHNTGITGTSKFGETDINIINTDDLGNATGIQTEQILQTLYPEEFAAYKQSLVDAGVESVTFPKIKDGKFVYDPKNPGTGARLTDEDLYQLMRDDNNAWHVLINDMFSSVKTKHIDRANNMLFDKNRTDQVRSILDRLGRSKMGDYYQTIEQMYPNLQFNDVEANKEFLRMLDLPETYAENPEIMRNLAQRYAIISEYVTRGVNRAHDVTLEDMLITNYAYNGGSWSGPGGNALQSGYGQDAGVDAEVIGIMRSRYTTHPENVKTLGDYTKAIERARSRTVETALGTPEGEKLINDIFKQNGIVLDQPIPQIFDNTNIQWTDWVRDVVLKTENDSKIVDKKTKRIIDEVSKALDSPRVDTQGYSGTYTGTLELPTDLRMRHNSANSATYQRGSLKKVNSNNQLLFDVGFADPLMQDVQKMFAEKGFAYVPGKGLVVVSSKAPQSVLKYIEKRQQMFPYQEEFPYTYMPYDGFSEALKRWEKKITEAQARKSSLEKEYIKIEDAYRELQEFFNTKIGVDLDNKENRELIENIYGRIPERVKTYNKRMKKKDLLYYVRHSP